MKNMMKLFFSGLKDYLAELADVNIQKDVEEKIKHLERELSRTDRRKPSQSERDKINADLVLLSDFRAYILRRLNDRDARKDAAREARKARRQQQVAHL
jgi:hypothetical protein